MKSQTVDIIFEGGPRVANVFSYGKVITMIRINRINLSVEGFRVGIDAKDLVEEVPIVYYEILVGGIATKIALIHHDRR